MNVSQKGSSPKDAISFAELEHRYPVAFDAFKQWATWRHESPQRSLSTEAIDNYRTIWHGYLRFLAAHDIGWEKVKSDDVLNYLGQIAPRAKGSTQRSDVTVRRYARIIKEVYEHAVRCSLIEESPVNLSTKEIPSSEKADSFIFNPAYYRAIAKWLPQDHRDPQACRNRAILSCMLFQGMTSSEVGSLKLPNLVYKNQDSVEVSWMKSAEARQLGVPEAVQLQGSQRRPDQARTLSLDPATASALQGWMNVRYVTAGSDSEFIFCSIKQKGGLTNKALFEIARDHIIEALRKEGVTDRLVHAGPTALRNSCIIRWLIEKVDYEEIRRRAGLKEARYLVRLIAHLSPAEMSAFMAYEEERQERARQGTSQAQGSESA